MGPASVNDSSTAVCASRTQQCRHTGGMAPLPHSICAGGPGPPLSACSCPGYLGVRTHCSNVGRFWRVYATVGLDNPFLPISWVRGVSIGGTVVHPPQEHLPKLFNFLSFAHPIFRQIRPALVGAE